MQLLQWKMFSLQQLRKHKSFEKMNNVPNAEKAPARNVRGLFLTGNNLSSRAASSQVLSTRESLTAVFGMGTGGTSQPSSPDRTSSQTFKTLQKKLLTILRVLTRILKSSPRRISTGPLNTLLHLHSRPINLVFFKASY